MTTYPFGATTDERRLSPGRGLIWQLAVVDGELDIATAPMVAATLLASTESTDNWAGVVVDLAQVKFCDSEGLAALMSARDLLEAAGHDVVWRNPSPRVVTMIDLFYGSIDVVERPDDRRECRPTC